MNSVKPQYFPSNAFTLWLFNIAMGKNGPFIDDVPIKTFIYKGFSMAMLNNQLVNAMQSHIAMKFSINSQHLGQTPSVPHRRGAGSEREHQ